MRITALFLGLWLSVFAAWQLAAQTSSHMPTLGAGGPVAGGGGYTGPGDVVSGAKAWYGFRAYNNTWAAGSGKIANICLASNTSCTDMVSNSSGNMVITAPGGTTCTAINCFVHTLYDQSGNNGCSGGPCDIVQATAANQPLFIPSCIASLPCMKTGTNASIQLQGPSSGPVITAEPITAVFYGEYLGSMGTNNVMAYCNGGTFIGGSSISMYDLSAVQSILFSASAFHAAQGVLNGSSSVFYVDGASTGVAAPGGAPTCGNGSSGKYTIGAGATAGVFVNESGIWAIAFSGGQQSSMNSNMVSYW
jgi:hypothetical protein